MSYIEPTDSSAKYYGSYTVTGTDWQGNDPTTWMPLDILAAQQLYGVAKATPLSGGQVFGFNCNVSGVTEQFFDFTINKTPVITVWDAGTGNTLDLSGYSTTATVNLNAGAYSSFAGMTNNMAIAYGTAIDTVIGTSGDDIFMSIPLATRSRAAAAPTPSSSRAPRRSTRPAAQAAQRP